MDLKYMLSILELQYYDADKNKHICKVCNSRFKLVDRVYLHIENKHWEEVTELSNTNHIQEIIRK